MLKVAQNSLDNILNLPEIKKIVWTKEKKVRYERIFVDQILGSCVRDYVYFKY